jgi:hypothetical protein
MTQRPQRTQRPRHVQHDNSVSQLEPKAERLVIVAVRDPLIASERNTLELSPLRLR